MELLKHLVGGSAPKTPPVVCRGTPGCYRRFRRHVLTRLVIVSVAAVWAGVLIVGLLRRPEVKTCAFVNASLGLGCEEHVASTKDGYSLLLKRVPMPGGPPVVLLAGVLESSAQFVVPGPIDSLAGDLHHRGFDVWLLEQRGRAPWRHDRFTGQDMEFWDFSLDETVAMDLPAMIDFVRRFTGQPVASIIGHAEGGMLAILAAATSRVLANHTRSVVALGAPIGTWAQTARAAAEGKPAPSAMAQLPEIPEMFVRNLHPGVLWGLIRILSTGVCSIAPKMCARVLCSVGGCAEPANFAPELVSRMTSCFPRETSLKTLQHLSQLSRGGALRKFDHGVEENRRRYNGSPEPPLYDLSALRTPLALFYGERDKFVPPASHAAAAELLPAEAVRKVSLKQPFGRADFAWAQGAHAQLFSEVAAFITEMNQ